MKSIKQHFTEYQNNGGTMTLQEFKNDGRIDEFEVIAYYFNHLHNMTVSSIRKDDDNTDLFHVFMKATSKTGVTVLPECVKVVNVSFAKNYMQVSFNYSQIEKHLH